MISHKGSVLSSDGGKIRVEIVSKSACEACHAAGLCGMSESSRKIIEIPAPPSEVYLPGQEVEVCLAPKTGLKAVLLSYVVPVTILLILILSLLKAGLSEIAAGLFSVLGVAVYYFAVYLFRDHLTEGYEFFIRR